MQPSSPSSRGNSRVGSIKYAHSPYVYRTTVEDAPVSPMSDQGRSEPGSVPLYHSPRSLSQSGGNAEASGPANGSQVDVHSQPNSPLGRSTSAVQEYSQPIQVGSAPNVHPRYRRSMQSPLSRPGNESGGRSGFPSSPSGSLPPWSPFMAREDSTSAFSGGGESAPVRGLNNPYRMPTGTGVSAPQYAVPLSGSYRGGAGNGNGGGSGPQTPSPIHNRQHSGTALPTGCSFLPPPTSPPSMATHGTGYAPSSSSNATSNTNANNNNTTSYAPTGFSMPPTMASTGSGAYHASPSGRTGSHSASYVDPRSSHPSSPLLSGNRGSVPGSSPHTREPISPTHAYSGGSYNQNLGPDGAPYSPNNNSRGSNGGPPPSFAAAAAQLQQQHHNGSFGVGSYPGRRGAPPSHPSSPFASHMNLSGAGGAESAQMGESYGTNTKTLSTMADDTMSSSGKSGSSASSIRDDLPLCPNDDACTTINDRKHQKKFAHTCRLFPCYHGHVTRHAKLFRHAPGQISLPEGMSANAKVSSQALASVNFSTISPEAPNAYRIYVSHGDKSYEIFGDWASVKVHTFKRYLHQVYHIAPGSQILSVVKTGKVMDDDINTVKCYGIEEDSVIQLRSDSEDTLTSGRLRIPLDDL